MGVGAGPEDADQADWVLAGFEESERDAVSEMLRRAGQLVRDAVASGTVTSVTSDPATTSKPGDDREDMGNDDD